MQNAVPLHAWRDAISDGRLATVRGIALDDEDRLRRAVIERLMCDLSVDLEEVAATFGVAPDHFATEIDALRSLTADGVVLVEGHRIEVPQAARPLVRVVASTFDQYLGSGTARHARAV